LFDDACGEILGAPAAKHPTSEPGNSREERLLSAAKTYQAVSHHLAMMQQVRSLVEKACSEAESSVQHWKDAMLAEALMPSPLDAHAIETAVRLLKATGLTTTISRRITASQVERIAAIVSEVAINIGPAPSGSSPQHPIEVKWSAGNPWVSMPTSIPGYRLTERPVTPHEAGLAAVFATGLPPSTDLANFAVNLSHTAFQVANTNHAKVRECWSLLDKWLKANKVIGCWDPATTHLRKRAWVFMFAVQGGFINGIADFEKIRFPSPWQANTVIEAQRI